MEVTRTPPSIFGDWLTAAALLGATVLVGVLVVRELRVAPRAAAATTEPVSATSVSVPSDAVSVPTLMLGAGNEIRVGDARGDALARLDAVVGETVTLVKQAEERGPLGAREIRAYQLAGTRFILVFEPFERRGAPRVAAIYLQ
jgi:hypothetical protein